MFPKTGPMASLLRYWLKWPSLEVFMSWGWPICETFHFIGLCLLVGIVGIYDLRVLGMAKGVPLSSLKRLLPWAVFGFVLCLVTGALFVGGIGSSLPDENAYNVLVRDIWLQLKLLFLFLAGINLGAFYLTGMARAVESLGPADDAPLLAKVMAGISLSLWIAIVICGRLLPRGY